MTTKTSPFFGVFIGIAISLCTVWSFSIQSHILHSNPHSAHRSNQNLQQYRHSPNDRTSLGFWNIDDRGKSDRPRKLPLAYLNYDLDVFDLGHLDDGKEETKDDLMKIQRLISENHSRPEPSVRHGWGRLNDSTSSQSTLPLEWSTFIPKGVSASVFSSGKDSSSPLVLTPDPKNPRPEAEFLRSFLRSNKNWVDERILEYGSIVFRGFGNFEGTVAVGKEILRALDSGDRTGRSTSGLDAARKGFEIYLVSDTHNRSLPPSSLQHYNTGKKRPKRITEISTRAGLTDWRRIHDSLPSNLRRKLTEKDLLYTRNHLSSSITTNHRIATDHATIEDDILWMDELGDAGNSAGREPSAWYRLFGSTNKRILAKTYRRLIEPMVQPPTESTFRSEAFRLHPHTGKKIWFEFAHRFHWTSSPAELLAEFRRTKNPFLLARAWKEAAVVLWRRLRGDLDRKNSPLSISSPHGQPEPRTSVSFGDGTPISWWEMRQIRKFIRDNTANYFWKPGDFLVVDGPSMGLQQ